MLVSKVTWFSWSPRLVLKWDVESDDNKHLVNKHVNIRKT